MSKVSFSSLVAVVLVAGLVYLAIHPEVGYQVLNWVRGLFNGGGDLPSVNSTGYIPVVPGR